MPLRAALVFLLLVNLSTAFVVKQPTGLPCLSSLTHKSLALATNRQQEQQTALSLFTDADSSLLLTEQSLSLRNVDVWIFIAGLIPFGWATVEFWRRIAVGEPFGTGSDSVFIGKDGAPDQSRGRRVLDRGAFLVAYLLFGIAAAAIGITLFSVVTSPPMELSSSSSLVTPPSL